ncbi:MAG: hypothetical protein E7418_04965 [Ruminococcaceae bacterium]|nr:hypothetical protein [Oscillospiraceae bacterium]
MKKSVYSLVLTDAVVEAADRLSYIKGMSRSALIDELLARALSCMTPEMRLRDIFVTFEEQMRDDTVFRMQNRASDSMLSLFSAIQYKYKPTIRYSVELFKQPQGGAFGALRIQSRTHSAQLLCELEDFYRLFIATERRLSGNRGLKAAHEEGRLMRLLAFPPGKEDSSESELGEALVAYIKLFDRAMKQYFALLHDRAAAQEQIALLYATYLNTQPLIIF